MLQRKQARNMVFRAHLTNKRLSVSYPSNMESHYAMTKKPENPLSYSLSILSWNDYLVEDHKGYPKQFSQFQNLIQF